MLPSALAAAPRPLLLVCALFCLGAFFPTRFADVPGTSVGSYASTVLIALPAALALGRFLGPRRAALSLLALSLFGYAIETVGVVTGFPYGPFEYGDSLGPKALGLVPYLLPVTWAPLVLGAVGATAPTKPSTSASPLRFFAWISSSAVLLALVDGVLDPGAVALGFWSYEGSGPYYGVPFSNYLGWLLSSTLAAALVLVLGRGAWGRAVPPPGLLDSALLSVAFWTGVALYSGRVVPLLLGALLFAFLLHRRARLSGRRP
jgi:putative membrane protein